MYHWCTRNLAPRSDHRPSRPRFALTGVTRPCLRWRKRGYHRGHSNWTWREDWRRLCRDVERTRRLRRYWRAGPNSGACVRVLVTGGSGFIGSRFLADYGRLANVTFANLDCRDPSVPFPSACVQFRADLKDSYQTAEAIHSFMPTHVIHLAARTDTASSRIDEYLDNTLGTRNLLLALEALTVDRILLTSTQYVHATDKIPTGPQDFSPFTAYGSSKVQTEIDFREWVKDHPTSWLIVRPTNVWGPHHPRYADEFWRVVAQGLYLHPKLKVSPRRAYGYVGNVSSQLWALLNTSVSEEVIYLGDPLVDLDDWVDAFHVALRGKPARRVPLALLQVLAHIGDAAARIHLAFPLNTSRLGNMVADSAAPMERVQVLAGANTFDLESGVQETIAWLRTQSSFRDYLQ
jgi:nucleoside-diphosphate-sugar epimerase